MPRKTRRDGATDEVSTRSEGSWTRAAVTGPAAHTSFDGTAFAVVTKTGPNRAPRVRAVHLPTGLAIERSRPRV